MRPALEVADILRAHGEAYQANHRVSAEQAAVMRHLVTCRTAALGGHVDACDQCGFQRVSYNSCRDRHCPKCQAAKRAQWVEQRLARLLPVPYFHVVFTLPEPLKPLVLRNRRRVYELLFRAASATLLQLAADPKRLGAQIGLTAVLHTWSQNLLFHPHLHCVVTGGGLTADGDHWVAAREGYLLPVKVMARLFRGKFLHGLQQLYETGELSFAGSTESLNHPRAFAALRDQLYRQDWIVYAKPPFGGAEHVYRYLGRYTHRVAIANSRLIAMEGDRVRFHWKDYAHGNQIRQMTLSAEEFIRRFLLHVLPKRFVRIRHYGLMAGRNVDTRLARCRALLESAAEPSSTPSPSAALTLPGDEKDWKTCPRCRGALRRRELPAGHAMLRLASASVLARPVETLDSS
ncbi:MAG: IS91 family transposase [Halothiobacillaceae bacterium]